MIILTRTTKIIVASCFLCSFLYGCMGVEVNRSEMGKEAIYNATDQMVEVYSQTHEVSFCLSEHGIYSVIQGGAFSVELPICGIDDAVFHSHPPWGGLGASIADYPAFREYKRVYGNIEYGVLKGDKYKLYRVEGEE